MDLDLTPNQILWMGVRVSARHKMGVRVGARHRILVGIRSRFIEFRMGLWQDIGFGLVRVRYRIWVWARARYMIWVSVRANYTIWVWFRARHMIWIRVRSKSIGFWLGLG